MKTGTQDIDGESLLFGIIGHPVGHSLSPLIHNAAFRYKKINGVYIPFSIEKANSSLKKTILSIDNLRGLSVTIPHKTWAVKVADRLDPLSECCGAANTLITTPEGELHAFNTDGPGALLALQKNIKTMRGKRFLLIGYGGSAMAIAHALLLEENPSLLYVSGRNKKKLAKFAESIRAAHTDRATAVRTADFSDIKSEDIDIIIHTTPLGMQGKPQELPLPEDFIQKFHVVFDIVYNPARTTLLKHAAARGAKTIPGYLMLLYQATLQFEKFTGQKAPENLMESELLKALRRR